MLTQITRGFTLGARRVVCKSLNDGLPNHLGCTGDSIGLLHSSHLRSVSCMPTQSTLKPEPFKIKCQPSWIHKECQPSLNSRIRQHVESTHQSYNSNQFSVNQFACKQCVQSSSQSRKTELQNKRTFLKSDKELHISNNVLITDNLTNKVIPGTLFSGTQRKHLPLFDKLGSVIGSSLLQVRYNTTSVSSPTIAKVKAKSEKKDSKESVEKKHLKSRPRTKNPSRLAKEEMEDYYLCTAFSTAEEYNLEHLNFDLQAQNLCVLSTMPQDVQDVLHMKTNNSVNGGVDREPGEIFFFREGSVVFWNVKNTTMKKVMRIVSKHEIGSYEVALVNWENEQMMYKYTDHATRLVKDEIMLSSANSSQATTLEKFTFSNAMALSVKLAIWEYSLDKFVGSIEWVPENLKAGRRLKMSMQEVMTRVGQLFELRHHINLSSDLLMTPDFYWDREGLEMIYNRMCNYLNIARRTKVMNEKLNHCSDMVELMRTHLNDRHSLRLEWMIILLIAIEVVFEIVHYVERFIEKQFPAETVTGHSPST